MKIQKSFLSLLLLACFSISTIASLAEEIPTLDFSQGHDYSLLEKAGIYVSPRNPKSSQSILNKKFKILLGKDKIISIGSQGSKAVNSWALVWCPPKDTNLQFIAVSSGFLTAEQTKKSMEEIRKALGWGDDDFEKTISASTEFHKWLKVNRTNSPYYAVEVQTSYLKETPFYIHVTIAWDVNIIEKEFPDMDRWRQELLNKIKPQSNSPSASTR